MNGKDLERLATPLQARRLDGDTPLLDQPADAALEMARLPAGKEVAVMAGFGEFLLVESPEGKTGWMSD